MSNNEPPSVDEPMVGKPLADKITTFIPWIVFYWLLALILVEWLVWGYVLDASSSIAQAHGYTFAAALLPLVMLSRRTLRCFDGACPRGKELWVLMVLIIAPFFLVVATSGPVIWTSVLAAIVVSFFGTKWLTQNKRYRKALDEQRGGKPKHRLMPWFAAALKAAMGHTGQMITLTITGSLLGYFFAALILFSLRLFTDGFSGLVIFSVITVCLFCTYLLKTEFLFTGNKYKDHQLKEFDSMVKLYFFVVYFGLNFGALPALALLLGGV